MTKQKCFFSRILSGTADAAFWGSVVSILMKLFPKHVATIAAWTEMLFSLGYMLGNVSKKFPILIAQETRKNHQQGRFSPGQNYRMRVQSD